MISLEESAKLTSEDLQQPTLLSTEPKLQQAADQANAMITANLTLTLAGDVAVRARRRLVEALNVVRARGHDARPLTAELLVPAVQRF